jgi:hypothetical protein
LDIDLATTFSMLILYDQKVLASWHGDSRIYHLREGEILFSTKDKSLVSESIRNTAIAYGIKTDSSPVYAETEWIEDVRDGDYFLLCSKDIIENITDENIKLFVSQYDKENIDLTGSFRRFISEKIPENYSMYLVRVSVGAEKKGITNGIVSNRKQKSVTVGPISVLVMTIIILLVMVFYFRNARTSNPVPDFRSQTTQAVNVQRHDSSLSTIKHAPRNQLVDVFRDSVPRAIVMSVPRKPIPVPTDSVKNTVAIPQVPPQKDNSTAMPAEEKPKQIIRTPISQKKQATQMLIKFTTDEPCKLKITKDSDEVIDWDLSQDDNGTIFLKPGKYSIVATSAISSSKTRTYNFDVKPGSAKQSIHIKF